MSLAGFGGEDFDRRYRLAFNATKNRFTRTASSPMDQTRSPMGEGVSGVPEAERAFPMLRWKTGVEAPPFSKANPEAIHLLMGLANGSAPPPHAIAISKAVAVQIWLLVFDEEARVEELGLVGGRVH